MPPTAVDRREYTSLIKTQFFANFASLWWPQHLRLYLPRPFTPRVPDDLMPADLRWSWCDSNRNQVPNKFNVFKSSQTHPPTLVHGNTVFHKTSPWCQKDWGPIAKFTPWVGDRKEALYSQSVLTQDALPLSLGLKGKPTPWSLNTHAFIYFLLAQV